MRWLLATFAAIALIGAACGDDDNAPPTGSPSPTPSVARTPTRTPARTPTDTPVPATGTPAPTPTPSPAPTPAVTPSPPVNLEAARVIFTPRGESPYTGKLWVADLAGHTQQLTTVDAVFVGLTGDPFAGAATLYYTTDATDESAILYRRELPDGSPARTAFIRPWSENRATGALSPDGRYIAYTDRYGLELLDLQTYEFRLIATGGDRDACWSYTNIGACKAFDSPKWSPDGKLISVSVGYWEGGEHFIVDPFTPGSRPILAGNSSGGHWSPSSQAICSYGEYGGPSALFISQAPDWIRKGYPQTEAGADTALWSVDTCAWLDNDRVAMSVNSWAGPPPDRPSSYLGLFTLADGTVRKINYAPSSDYSMYVVGAPTRDLILVQLYEYSGTQLPHQPTAINVTTGEQYSLLHEGDWIIDVITPQ
jgi:hypothetical protein